MMLLYFQRGVTNGLTLLFFIVAEMVTNIAIYVLSKSRWFN